jgi:hypothetical protein
LKKEEKNVKKIDEKIMEELLQQPGIKETVAEMNPETLAFYKELLVSQRIYARYVKERKKNGNGLRRIDQN